jgi:hypothetical protein
LRMQSVLQSRGRSELVHGTESRLTLFELQDL